MALPLRAIIPPLTKWLMSNWSVFLIVIRPDLSSRTAMSFSSLSTFSPYRKFPSESWNFFYPRTPMMSFKMLGLSFCSLKSVPMITVSSKGLISRILSTILRPFENPPWSIYHFIEAVSFTIGRNFSSLKKYKVAYWSISSLAFLLIMYF